ncbi:energy transducer TonB [Desulfopila sp. IMCC35006]|uniref:energy transducer TonB n=1 Tax=Desulfopila sp. IMCC35006 TaxID=2569542 RepID=UPI0010AC8D1A|nr:energy transducer TonB [Desulfopila sp. IMCC35006]TKB24114.1 energy transducer TonB [Desulfopila sp. IMCC35006]
MRVVVVLDISDKKQLFRQLLMNRFQFLSFQKQRLVTVPDWLGSVLIHLLIAVVVVAIGYLPSRKKEIVWVNLSEIALEMPDPAVVSEPKTIAPEHVVPQNQPKTMVPEQIVPQTSIPVAPIANEDRAELQDNPPIPEEQSIAQNITIEPKASQPNRPAPRKISKAGKVKQKMSRSAASPKITLPSSRPEVPTAGTAPPAPARTEAAPVVSGETSAAAETSVAAETRYLQANFTGIRRKVSSKLRYPSMARRQGWQGQVQVRFSILLSGEIDDLRVLSSSGYSLLDRQALQAVQLAAPFPAPSVVASITLPVTFTLK